MNGTPSDWACMAATDPPSIGPPSTWRSSRPLSAAANRDTGSRRIEAHPLHVRDEVHGLGDVGELVGAEVQEQEHRPLGDAADGIAEHPDRVIVGPLRVVDEQRDRLQVGQLLDRDAGEVEGPQQLGVRRERLEARLVSPAERVGHAPNRDLRPRADGHLPQRAVAEEAPCDQERPPDLLVCRDRHRGESRLGGQLRRSEEESCLADARLTLERDRRQVAPGLPDGLFDGRQLHRPPDDRARRAPELDIQRALRLDERVEGLALEEPHRAAPGLRHHRTGLCAPIAFDPARLPAGPAHEKAAGLGARRPFGCGSVEPSWIRPGRYPFGFDRGARSSRPPRSRRRSRRRRSSSG